jgi:hypothetical protein
MRSRQSAGSKAQSQTMHQEIIPCSSVRAPHFVIALLQSLLSETRPRLLPVDSLRHLKRNIEVAAFHGEIETSCLVLNKVESDLRRERRICQLVGK